MNDDRGECGVLYWQVIVLSFLLVGCSRHQLSEKHTDSSDIKSDYLVQSALIDNIIKQEAMLVNIPLPLYDERILPSSLDTVDRDVIVLGYKSSLTPSQIIDFFLSQMERYGWKQLVLFAGFESILQFKNPDFYCTILVRSLEKNFSSIFIYMKRTSC